MNLTSELLDQALPQAPAATGMVRIARGGQQRWIWPVHLPGWIALGWQVSHPGTSAPAAAAVPGVGEPVAEAPMEPKPAAVSLTDTPAATNGRRRGRRAKAQEPMPVESGAEEMAAVTAAEQDTGESSVDAAAEAVPEPATTELPSPEVNAVETPEDAAAPAFVLPDDLLSETF